MDSSVNHLLDAQSSSISENTAPSILISDFLDGKTCTTRLRRLSSRLARSWTLLVRMLALPQNQPNAPLYPAGGAPGSRPGALPHFGRPRYLGPPPRARSTAG